MLLFEQQSGGLIDQYKAFAENCMAEYDLDGWTVPDLSSMEDIRRVRNDILNG